MGWGGAAGGASWRHLEHLECSLLGSPCRAEPEPRREPEASLSAPLTFAKIFVWY